MDVSEVTDREPEQQLENASDSDNEDSEDEADCEITDSEEREPVQANSTALEISIVHSQKNGAFDRTLVHQRGPEPSKAVAPCLRYCHKIAAKRGATTLRN